MKLAVYDSSIKRETIQNIERVSRETAALEQAALDDASIAVTISHASHPLLDTWDELKQLSEEAMPSAKQKIAAERVRKKLQRKD